MLTKSIKTKLEFNKQARDNLEDSKLSMFNISTIQGEKFNKAVSH